MIYLTVQTFLGGEPVNAQSVIRYNLVSQHCLVCIFNSES